MTSKAVVGFVGLGEQGTPIAQRILGAGYPMVLWARRSVSLEPFRGTSAEIAGTLKELGACSDTVCLCVLHDEDVEEVLHGGLLEGMSAGQLIAVNSTTKPETSQRLSEEAAQRGVVLIDAPVTGMAKGAAEGSMAIFVGGSKESFERYAPIARTFGTPVHMGPVGTGQACKLLNNITSACNGVVAQDAMAVGLALGMAPDALSTALMHGSAGSRWLERYKHFGYDPLFNRNPQLFLRDWSRVYDDFCSMVAGHNVPGQTVEQLGAMFVERTAERVKQTGSTRGEP